MNFPCPIAIHCGDYPFANLSSEGGEPCLWCPPVSGQYFTSRGYCCDGTVKIGYSTNSQAEADAIVENILATACPNCITEPPGPQEFCANADCPDGTNITKICVPSSQADADKLAAQAAAAMLPFCVPFNPPENLFESTCACPDGVTDVHTTRSNISQEIADAECEVIPKNCPGACNEIQVCTAIAADGSSFTYTILPCTVTAATIAEANARALELCHTNSQRVQMTLGPLPRCCCRNEPYSEVLSIQLNPRPVTWSVSAGALPVGITLASAATTDGKVLITGTPLISGNYIFSITATDADGNYVVKAYEIDVIEIATATVPNYTVGVPYTAQLLVSGGSANFQFIITAGELPSGLTLSPTGLISGTPTGLYGGGVVQFEVIDVTCQLVDKSVFVPHLTLRTTSITTTRTKHGWFAYGTNSGTLYKRFDVTGSITQIARTSPLVKPPSIGLEFCGGAKQVYSGYCQLNLSGSVVHLHDKHLTFACDQGAPLVERPFLQPDNTFFWTPEDNVSTLLGYCWQDDPESCDLCSPTETDWIDGGNYAQANSRDIPWNMLIDEDQIATTPTVLSYNHTAERFFDRIVREDQSYPTGFPHGSTNVYEIDEPWIRISSTGNFTITLSDPYTDAEAESTKVVIVGSGSVANGGTSQQWATQYIQNVSVRITDVSFAIHCTNLVAGEEYTINYELWNQTTNAKTIVTQTFVATDSEEDVFGTVPRPPFGQSVKIRDARIRLT